MFSQLSKKPIFKMALVGGGNAINAFFGFAYLAVTARSLSVTDFGKYTILASLLVLLSKILDFGTNSTFVAESITNNDHKLHSNLLATKLVLYLIALPITLIALYLFKLLTIPSFILFFVGLIFYLVNYTLFAMFQKLEKYLVLVLLFTIPAIIKGLFALLIFMGHLKLTYIHNFTIFALSIGPSALLYFFLPKYLKTLKLDFSMVGQSLKKALSPGISQLINESFSTVNNFFNKLFSSFNDVGIFSLADKISSVFTLISFSIFTVLLPKNANRKRADKTYNYKESALIGLGILLLATLTTQIAYRVVPWFFDNKYNESLVVLNILIYASAITAIHVFLENYYYVEKKTNILIVISITKLLLLIIASLILMPSLGIKGLAWSQLLASSITLLLSWSIIKFGGSDKANT